MISDREEGVVELAPRAMPSARAWMQRPRVVEREGAGGWEVDRWGRERSESE